MAYAFGHTDLIKLLKTAFSASVGHDHDGTNSKAVANGVTLAGTQTLTNKTLTSPTINGGTATSKSTVTAYAADGAVAIGAGVARLTKASAGAYTLAAPAAADEGTVLHIVAGTDYAHVVTIASTSARFAPIVSIAELAARVTGMVWGSSISPCASHSAAAASAIARVGSRRFSRAIEA